MGLFYPFGIVHAESCHECHDENSSKKETHIKPTDLPIYSDAVKESKGTSPSNTDENSETFKVVQQVRVTGCKTLRILKGYKDRTSQFLITGKAHAESSLSSTFEFLHQENNLLPRMGAVGAGALVGYILAIRKGLFKRLLYTTTLATAAAALCYPEMSKQYTQEAAVNSRKYMVIGYHFLNGVTKDLGGFELPSYPLTILNKEETKEDKSK